MRTTIQDVAKAAGVSISTVSKVLNGHYSISEKTAEHVRQVMRELNYYPSANAQNFASGTNRLVVLWRICRPTRPSGIPICLKSLPGWRRRCRKEATI